MDRELDASRIRELAEEILSRPEYADDKLDLGPPHWLRWLVELLDRFMSWINGLYVTSPILYWLFLAGLLLVSCLLIWHIAWSISRAMRDRTPQPPAPVHREMDFRALAEELSREGRHLEAAHQLLLACLQRSAQTGLIELHPDDTNLVARARLKASPLSAQLRAELQQLIGTTERAWFRDRSSDPGLYDRWTRAHRDLVRETG